MGETGAAELGYMVILAVVVLVATITTCWFWVKRETEKIISLWDDIYFRLRERGHLVGELNQRLRVLLRTNPKLVEDIQYLLQRMAETNDPHTHAAVQNSLVLTVQTAVEQFHRDAKFQTDADLKKTMDAIGAVDSRLAPLRDRYNDSVRSHNKRLNTLPFSLATKVSRTRERSLFPMMIPWWSTESAAYGKITADEVRHHLQTWKAPLILVPSQRSQWPNGTRVIHVPRSSDSQGDKGTPTSRQRGEPCS
jgi:hypothetical protein